MNHRIITQEEPFDQKLIEQVWMIPNTPYSWIVVAVNDWNGKLDTAVRITQDWDEIGDRF